MPRKRAPLLHRDDPDKEPLVGHVKVTRADWLNLARDILVTEGVAEVKILPMSARLGVSRSSFYWYFENREDLLSALLDEWETRNTQRMVEYCGRPAANITQAVNNFFRCFVDPSLFDPALDFAVREWARRDARVRGRIDAADANRIRAATDMFARFGYATADADARARILYFMQLGYHALEVKESVDTRMSRIEPYMRGFTGQEPDPQAIAEFDAFARRTLAD